MDRLIKIGFIKAGYWVVNKNNTIFQLFLHEGPTKVHYSFVSEREIKYIGKTTSTLLKRMKGYQNPGTLQRTNLRVREKIKNQLDQGSSTEIYVLPDNGLLKYRYFNLSIAAGLEDT